MINGIENLKKFLELNGLDKEKEYAVIREGYLHVVTGPEKIVPHKAITVLGLDGLTKLIPLCIEGEYRLFVVDDDDQGHYVLDVGFFISDDPDNAIEMDEGMAVSDMLPLLAAGLPQLMGKLAKNTAPYILKGADGAGAYLYMDRSMIPPIHYNRAEKSAVMMEGMKQIELDWDYFSRVYLDDDEFDETCIDIFEKVMGYRPQAKQS